MKFCVIGAGSGGRAFAAYLSSKGYEVNIYNRSYYRISEIRKIGGIQSHGEIEGFFPISLATQNLAQAVKGVDIIFIVTPASAHRTLAKKMAYFLDEGQMVILNPGRTFGSVEFLRMIENRRGKTPVLIAETQTLLFTCRADEKNGVEILKIKNSVKFTSFPDKYIDLIHEVLNPIFPQLVPVDNYLEVTLNNIGMLVHPTISLLNAGLMDNACDFKFYSEGASPRVCKILEKIEFEINEIFKKLGLKQFRFHKWAMDSYGIEANNLYDAIQKIETYKSIKAPKKLVTRYFTEDVPTGLVAVSSLGDFLNIATPTIDSVIHLSGILCGHDFNYEGRTIEKLSLEDFINERLELQQIPFGEALYFARKVRHSKN